MPYVYINLYWVKILMYRADAQGEFIKLVIYHLTGSNNYWQIERKVLDSQRFQFYNRNGNIWNSLMMSNC